MAIEILMPELGESVHEGTVSRWLKQEGDFVKEDEPVVEIMTDKVNTELPSPATGVLAKILVPEGGAVEVFKAMGLIEERASSDASAPAQAPAAQAPAQASAPQASATPATPAKARPAEGERRWYSPLVRSVAKERGLTEADLASIAGTGEGGRLTKADVEAHVPGPAQIRQPAQPPTPIKPGADQDVVQLAGMRKMIAEAMVRSAAVPTVSTVTRCDVTTMVAFRERNKDAFQAEHGVKLTYTPFFLKALAEALSRFPGVNSSLQGDGQVVTSKGVHLGVAVALGAKGDEGLIVPVIRDCQAKTLVQLAKDLDALAKAARGNALKPADVQGGTFTLTNPGSYGALFGTPMINAPQGGILGVYSINKEPVVIDDMLAIRSMMHLVLTYDHRIIDGLLAGKFLAAVRDVLQGFDFFK